MLVLLELVTVAVNASNLIIGAGGNAVTRFVPVIVTDVPTAPEFGLNPVTVAVVPPLEPPLAVFA
jgi:hypothetical protein